MFPDPPHTNAFRVYAPGEAGEVNERLISFMEREQVVVCSPMQAADVPGQVWTEFAVGPASMEWSAADIADTTARALLALIRQLARSSVEFGGEKSRMRAELKVAVARSRPIGAVFPSAAPPPASGSPMQSPPTHASAGHRAFRSPVRGRSAT